VRITAPDCGKIRCIGEVLELHDLAPRGASAVVDETPELLTRHSSMIATRNDTTTRSDEGRRQSDELAVVALGDEASLLRCRAARRIHGDDIESLRLLLRRLRQPGKRVFSDEEMLPAEVDAREREPRASAFECRE